MTGGVELSVHVFVALAEAVIPQVPVAVAVKMAVTKQPLVETMFVTEMALSGSGPRSSLAVTVARTLASVGKLAAGGLQP